MTGYAAGVRLVVLVLALIAIGCDPVNQITVRFPIAPSSTATVYWVHRFEGRTYAQERVFSGPVAEAELSVTRSECCGTAAAYRDRELWFIACVSTPGAEPMLMCGRPDDPPAALARATRPGTTCQAIDKDIGAATIDVATCTLTVPPPPAP